VRTERVARWKRRDRERSPGRRPERAREPGSGGAQILKIFPVPSGYTTPSPANSYAKYAFCLLIVILNSEYEILTHATP